MATIITKNSQTASAVPSAASLEVGELAVNTADGKLYTEHTGGVVKEIIPSTVSDGGITTAKIANSAVTEAKIADGAVTTNKLSNSGVTAGTYTTATVTVDAKGRVTAASSGSGGGVTSLNGQTGAITNTSVGVIGSYFIGYDNTVSTRDNTNNYPAGATVAGSNILTTKVSDIVGISVDISTSFTANAGLSGTWRRMSGVSGGAYGVNDRRGAFLFVRIS